MKKISLIILLLSTWVSTNFCSEHSNSNNTTQNNHGRVPTPTPVTSPEIQPTLPTADITTSLDLQTFTATVMLHNNEQEQELNEESVSSDEHVRIDHSEQRTVSGFNSLLNNNNEPFNFEDIEQQEGQRQNTPSPNANRRNALTPVQAQDIQNAQLPIITSIMPVNTIAVRVLRQL